MSDLLRFSPMTGFEDVKRLNRYKLSADYSHTTKEGGLFGIDVVAELERIMTEEFGKNIITAAQRNTNPYDIRGQKSVFVIYLKAEFKDNVIPKELEPLSINEFNTICKMGLTKFVSYDEYIKN